MRSWRPCWSLGRFVLPVLFAQAARTKNPELFLAISLLTVILASLATGAVGLSPILGALIAGILIAETDYHSEVEAITAPLAGLALGIFLITVGMRIDLASCSMRTGEILLAVAGVLRSRRWSPRRCCEPSGCAAGVALETGVLMASPSETSLIVLTAAARVRACCARKPLHSGPRSPRIGLTDHADARRASDAAWRGGSKAGIARR